MMDLPRTEGIVLRTQPVTESSLIVTWFTRDFGKLKTVAKGARRTKTPFKGKIDLFYRDEIVILRSRRSDLHILHECFLEDPYQGLRRSVEQLTAGSYVCELVELATEIEDANGKIFQLLEQTLTALEEQGEPVTLIWFELQLLAAAGWSPRWAERTGVSKVLRSLAATSQSGVRRVRLTDGQVRGAREALWLFWDRELGKAPRSRKLLSAAIQ